jgi:hypothetical protein
VAFSKQGSHPATTAAAAAFPLAWHPTSLMRALHSLHASLGVSHGLRRNVTVKHDDFALLILIIRGAVMNLI